MDALVSMHCNILLHNHIHLLCKMPFYKILHFKAFDDHTQKLKSFQYHVYPCISALELDVFQTLQVQPWTVRFFVTLYTELIATAEKQFTFTIPYNSPQPSLR